MAENCSKQLSKCLGDRMFQQEGEGFPKIFARACLASGWPASLVQLAAVKVHVPRDFFVHNGFLYRGQKDD